MGASSAIEAILAIEGMKRSVILPTINLTEDPEIGLDIPTRCGSLDQEFVLKNFFGFGGCNSCILFRRIS